jgi:hypothetical protein
MCHLRDLKKITLFVKTEQPLRFSCLGFIITLRIFIKQQKYCSNKTYSAQHVARMGERRGAYRALVGKPEGRRPLGRPRRRWEGNIKVDLREIGWGRRLD